MTDPPALPDRVDADVAPRHVIAFWREAGPSKWFKKDESFDRAFDARLRSAHLQAATGALDGWMSNADGALALILLLDQFPRNVFRGSARSFTTDARARNVADVAIRAGFDIAAETSLRPFVYMPFMHSENPADQARCVALAAPLDEGTHRFALLHQDIIRRFGRFPHRNALLSRTTTPEEQHFLDEGGFAG